MGAGRDGGRDLHFRGPLIWQKSEEQAGEVWDGYTVFQVKHKRQLAARPTTTPPGCAPFRSSERAPRRVSNW
jgi:hypothetical protein